MTKKKRAHPDIEEILQRPWCYYCERDFDDLKILISHQKAKHFKCERCGRRLNTVGGLSVHLNQVHKETLTTVENALPNRSEVGVEIFGMEGIPEEVLNAHQTRITEVYFRREAERRAATGNPGPGGQSGEGAKKQKIETPEDIKKRLAEHKARKQAEKMGLGSGSGGSTPVQGMPMSGPPMSNSPQAAFQSSFAPDSSSPPPGYNPYQQPPPHQPGYPPFAGSPVQQSPYGQPGFPQSPFTPMGHPFPQGMAPFPQGPPQHAFQPPPQQHFSPPAHSGPPVSAPLPQPAPGLPQRPSFNPPSLSKEEMAKMHSGAQLPPQPPTHRYPQPTRFPDGSWRFATPANPGSYNGLTADEIGDEVDDLINSVTGQTKYSGTPIKQEPLDEDTKPVVRTSPQPQQGEEPGPIENTPAKPSETPAPAHTAAPSSDGLAPASTAAGKPAKKAKKEKKGADITKLVYSDNATSPEEKMARYQRYSFDRMANEKTQFVQAEGGEDVGGSATVTGIIGSDTVRDPQD